MVGNFTGRNGHNYKVELAGEGVSDKTLRLASVNISMNAHERKFVGFKSTTASISILTDSPLLELYAEGVRDISVTITDITEDKVIFYGYVVPFTFEQPFSGCADSVTVECVDAITATKEVKYMSLNDEENYGIDETAEDIIRSIFSVAGMEKKDYKIIYNVNFGERGEAYLDKVKIAQAGFLQDEMTVLEAINSIFIFFGFTAALVGYELHLYDEHCMLHADDVPSQSTIIGEYKTVDGKRRWTRTQGSYRTVILPTSSIRDGITLSVERAYDGIQLKLNGSDTSVLLPDVCSMDNIIKNTDGRGTERVTLAGAIDGKAYWEFRMPVQSKVMDMGRWDGDTLVDWNSPAYIKATGDYAWSNGAMMIVGQHFNIETLDSYVGDNEYIFPKDGGETPLLWLRAYNTAEGFAGEQNFIRYAHTGGMLELKFKYRVVKEDWLDYTKTRDRGSSGYERFIQIKMGDVYYHKDYSNESLPVYSDRPYGYLIEKGGNLAPTWSAASRYQDKVLFIVPDEADGRQISVNLEWVGRAFEHTKEDDNGYISNTTYFTDGIFIEQLELVGYGDKVWEGHSDMRHYYVGSPSEILEANVTLSTRSSGQEDNPDKAIGVIGINARPSIVVDDFSHGGYMGSTSKCYPICGVVMEQLKVRYAEPHERFTMTMEGTGYRPSDIITFNGAKYTVEGYEIDLVNSTTQLIID